MNDEFMKCTPIAEFVLFAIVFALSDVPIVILTTSAPETVGAEVSETPQ